MNSKNSLFVIVYIGDTMNLYHLFERCCNASYKTAENGVSFAFERLEGTLYIFFEASRGEEDWKNNLDFPAKPYKRMGDCVWFAHRGFLKVWKSAEKYIWEEISDRSVKHIVIAGYSHGGALAVLCHEYVWFNRPDLRDDLKGYGFGCPRVVFGILPEAVKRRWENFTVVRNIDDIVTHLPPKILGYSHVGKLLEIGKKNTYTSSDAHKKQNILKQLKNKEQE